MRSTGFLTTSLLVALSVGLSGCAHPLRDFAAKAAGSRVGTAIADQVPAPATTKPTQKGGNFCDTAKELGAPVKTAGLPRNAATEFSVAANQFGADSGCWR